MNYRVVFSAQAKKALKKLNRHVYATIVTWIRRNLEGCDNPRLHGKGLTANRSGQWRYRLPRYIMSHLPTSWDGSNQKRMLMIPHPTTAIQK